MNGTRCVTCDRPVATLEDYDSTDEGRHLCWGPWNERCNHPPIDWRTRALTAERALSDADDAIRRLTAERDAARTALADQAKSHAVWRADAEREAETKLATRITDAERRVAELEGKARELRKFADVQMDGRRHWRETCAAAQRKIEELEARQQELLATIVRLTNETPYPDEIKGWTDQRAKLVAEIGTMRARVSELEAEVTTLRGFIKELDAEIAARDRRLGELGGRLAAAEEKARGDRKFASEQWTEIHMLRERIAAQDKRVAELEDALTGKEQG